MEARVLFDKHLGHLEIAPRFHAAIKMANHQTIWPTTGTATARASKYRTRIGASICSPVGGTQRAR
jgi:hypothetical protein